MLNLVKPSFVLTLLELIILKLHNQLDVEIVVQCYVCIYEGQYNSGVVESKVKTFE